MTIQPGRVAKLLDQINGGRAAQALPELERLAKQHPANPGILTLRAEALRLIGRLSEAIDAFRVAGEKGGGLRNWLAAGVLLAAARKTDDALTCLQKALQEAPENP